MSAVPAVNDSDDLQALFDSIVASSRPEPTPVTLTAVPTTATAPVATAETPPDLLTKIGQLTRCLHENLRALGYDRKIEAAAVSIPDARERLAYVATLTERAAIRVMNATDIARPIQEGLANGATALAARWRSVFAAQSSVDEFRSLAEATLAFLDEVPQRARATNAQIMEIVLAQDFQDLTGQVIKRINELVHRFEQELLVLLLQNAPAGQRPSTAAGLLNGPVVNAERAGEVVTTQAQVDDLLASLGY